MPTRWRPPNVRESIDISTLRPRAFIRVFDRAKKSQDHSKNQMQYLQILRKDTAGRSSLQSSLPHTIMRTLGWTCELSAYTTFTDPSPRTKEEGRKLPRQFAAKSPKLRTGRGLRYGVTDARPGASAMSMTAMRASYESWNRPTCNQS